MSKDHPEVDVGFGPEMIERVKQLAKLICDNTMFNHCAIPPSSIHAFAYEILQLMEKSK